MAFIVKKTTEPRIVNGWPVIVPTSIDGGKVREDEILVSYQVLAQGDVDAIVQSALASGKNADASILRSTVKDISGLVDEGNAPIQFGQEVLDGLLDQVNVRVAMAASYFDVASGRKAARKN